MTMDADVSGHAVLGVGTGVIDTTRVMLVRNSWGPDWGLQGHAWVSEDYLVKTLICAAFS